MIIDEVLKFNEKFVENREYEPYVTSKYPDKKLAVLSCMDTRLSVLLTAALGLKNGDAKIIKNAGAIILHPFDSVVRSLVVAIYELGVEEVMVIAHSNCGACHMNGPQLKAAMLAKGISQDVIDTIQHSGFDLDRWLEGFHDTEESVRKTVECIVNHPLIPKSVTVRGFVIDSSTGKLTPVC